MVLVFSSSANTSGQIIRELERAVNKGLTIIPFRIEEVPPDRDLEYFLGTPHWLDALTQPLGKHLDYLAETVSFLLERGERPESAPAPPSRRSPTQTGRRRLIFGVGVAAVLLAAGMIAFLMFGASTSPSAAPFATNQVPAGAPGAASSGRPSSVANRPSAVPSSLSPVPGEGVLVPSGTSRVSVVSVRRPYVDAETGTPPSGEEFALVRIRFDNVANRAINAGSPQGFALQLASGAVRQGASRTTPDQLQTRSIPVGTANEGNVLFSVPTGQPISKLLWNGTGGPLEIPVSS